MNQTKRTSLACPFCQVAPGEPCIGANGQPRTSVHVERWQRGLASKRKRAAKAEARPEGKLRKLLKARVESYYGTIRAVSWLGRRNAPDVLVLFPAWGKTTATSGHHVFVETKGVEPSAREAQLREHERMRDAGCTVLVILTEAELDKWLPPI